MQWQTKGFINPFVATADIIRYYVVLPKTWGAVTVVQKPQVAGTPLPPLAHCARKKILVETLIEQQCSTPLGVPY